MITKPNSEELNDLTRQKVEACREEESKKSGSSPSCTKTKSSKMEQFFALDVNCESSDATSGKHQQQLLDTESDLVV